MKDYAKTLLLVNLCLLSGIIHSAEYYVATAGNDTSGNGSVGSPWKTVKYSVAHLGAGDTLYVRGGLYRESYIDTFPSGTSNSARVTVKAYKNEKPIISSMSDVSGADNWTLISDNVYSYNGAMVNPYRNVSVGGEPLKLMAVNDNFDSSISDITGEGQWSRNQTNAKLWVHATGGVNPGTQNIEISYAYRAVYLQKTLQYITLEGLTIEGSWYPIDIEADYVVIKNCTFRNCFGDAIKVSGWTELKAPPEWNSKYGIIDNCDIYHFGESGIDITGGDYWQINNTSIHHGTRNRCPSEGDSKLSAVMLKNNNVGSIVNGCRIFNIDTRYGAITLVGSSSGSPRAEAIDLIVKNNIIHNVTGPEIITFTGAKDCKFINNVIYNCSTIAGISASEALIQMRCSDAAGLNLLRSSGVAILNNVFYDNTATYNYSEFVDGSDDSAVINNNFVGETRNSYFDGAVITHNNMVSQKGYDTNSYTDTPPFVNYAYELVRLSSASDASEGGVYDGMVQDDYNCLQRVINSPVSIGAYERLGSTIYCDGTSTADWTVPSGQTISKVHDDGLASSVIQTTGTAASTYTLFADASHNPWNNDEEFVIVFKGKFSSHHAFDVRFKSSDGTMKDIKFYSEYTSAGPHTSTVYRFPLGTGSGSTEDGNWHHYVFNLASLVNQVNSSESIDYIERFYVCGGGCVDDIELHNNPATAKMPKGLIGEWCLNEGTGGYTEDTSDKDRHGTLVNLSFSDPQTNSWILGYEQKALKFDKSVDKYVFIPNIVESFDTGFTIDTTVRFDNLDSSYDVIASGLQGNGAYGRLYEQYGYIYLQVKVDNGVFLHVRTLNNKIEAGKWHRITARCNMTGTLSVFVDGVDATDLTMYNYSFTATALDIGNGIMYIGSSPTSGHSFEGEIDSVKLYNRPLTNEEIAN